MRNPFHLAIPHPTVRPIERKIWLLEWMDSWEGGTGEVFNHRAFWDERAAIRAGQDMLERRLSQKQEPAHYIHRMKLTLEHTNNQGNHYCLGIFIKPLNLE